MPNLVGEGQQLDPARLGDYQPNDVNGGTAAKGATTHPSRKRKVESGSDSYAMTKTKKRQQQEQLSATSPKARSSDTVGVDKGQGGGWIDARKTQKAAARPRDLADPCDSDDEFLAKYAATVASSSANKRANEDEPRRRGRKGSSTEEECLTPTIAGVAAAANPRNSMSDHLGPFIVDHQSASTTFNGGFCHKRRFNKCEITTSDVICGSSLSLSYHAGNVFYRKLIEGNLKQYLGATRTDKSGIIRCIIDEIQSLDPPGRFVKNSSSNPVGWDVIGDHNTRQMISNSFRSLAASPSSTDESPLQFEMDDLSYLDVFFDSESAPSSRRAEFTRNCLEETFKCEKPLSPSFINDTEEKVTNVAETGHFAAADDKSSKKTCSVKGCMKWARQGGRCVSHSAAAATAASSGLKPKPERRPGKGGVSTPFPVRLHEILDQTEADGLSHVVSWQPHGRCFVVHKRKEFVEHVMPKYFKQTKFASFQRQLCIYGFNRLTTGPDKGGYYHEMFLRGKSLLGYRINRVKVKGTGKRKATNPDSQPNFYVMPPLVPVANAGSASDSDGNSATSPDSPFPDTYGSPADAAAGAKFDPSLDEEEEEEEDGLVPKQKEEQPEPSKQYSGSSEGVASREQDDATVATAAFASPSESVTASATGESSKSSGHCVGGGAVEAGGVPSGSTHLDTRSNTLFEGEADFTSELQTLDNFLIQSPAWTEQVITMLGHLTQDDDADESIIEGMWFPKNKLSGNMYPFSMTSSSANPIRENVPYVSVCSSPMLLLEKEVVLSFIPTDAGCIFQVSGRGRDDVKGEFTINGYALKEDGDKKLSLFMTKTYKHWNQCTPSCDESGPIPEEFTPTHVEAETREVVVDVTPPTTDFGDLLPLGRIGQQHDQTEQPGVRFQDVIDIPDIPNVDLLGTETFPPFSGNVEISDNGPKDITHHYGESAPWMNISNVPERQSLPQCSSKSPKTIVVGKEDRGATRVSLGLDNLGNTCYMNSTLQCLAHTPGLRQYFLSGKFEQHLNRNSIDGTKGELASEFANLLRQMLGVSISAHSSSSSVPPSNFKRVLDQHVEQFRGTSTQHDSQEFLTEIINRLHEDTNEITTKPEVEKVIQRKNESDADAAERAWSQHQKRERSYVVDTFDFLERSQVICSNDDCEFESTGYDPTRLLSLPIVNGRDDAERRNVDLSECISMHCEGEELGERNKFHCPRCNKRVPARKRLSIGRAPPILVIQGIGVSWL